MFQHNVFQFNCFQTGYVTQQPKPVYGIRKSTLKVGEKSRPKNIQTRKRA